MRKLFLLALILITPCPSLRADDKTENADIARLIHSLIVPQVPRYHEDTSNWGMTIPLPVEVRLPRVRRTLVQVGDHWEVPHGGWVRTKVWLDDPARDVQLRVTELRKVEGKGTRLNLEATISLHGERERQQWQKGLRLLSLTAQADAVIVASFDVELAVKVQAGKFPPEFSVDPKVLQTRLELKRFELNRVGPVQFIGKEARDLGEDLRGTLQEWLRQYEPRVTEKLNETLVKAVKSGKGKLLLPPPPKE